MTFNSTLRFTVLIVVIGAFAGPAFAQSTVTNTATTAFDLKMSATHKTIVELNNSDCSQNKVESFDLMCDCYGFIRRGDSPVSSLGIEAATAQSLTASVNKPSASYSDGIHSFNSPSNTMTLASP